jgi:hypothetical protein
MRYRVAFTKRVESDGEDSGMNPSAELDENLADGIVAEKVLVEQIETDAQHSQEELDEDDAFLGSAAPEVWDYDVVDDRAREFEQAIQNSDLVLEYDIIDETVTSRDEVSVTAAATRVYPRDGASSAGDVDDLNIVTANDPKLGLTNRGNKPAEDWAADTGPTRNPEQTVR